MRKPHRGLSRREFIRQSAFGMGAFAMGGGALAQDGLLRKPLPGMPPPAESGIDHVVVLMMENRSFDHYLGWVPGADGRQAGLSYVDSGGVAHSTHHLAPDYQGCGHPDPDHSYLGGRIQLNGGLCDGWLRAGMSDEYAIGYYTQADLRFFAGAVNDWTTCDRYFSSIMTATFPNRLYMHAAQSDRIDNSFAPSTLPTIWDRLSDAGLEGRYYFSDVPFLALWGAKYLPIARPFAAFLTDCRAGTLPAFSMVEPRFLGEAEGLSTDDHPHADIRNGQAFINQVYEAVVNGPRFRNTLLVITYDEWGGFFDHVPPPVGPIPEADQQWASDGLLGFRVPALVVSAFAPRRDVAHAELDHTSILKLVEWRWDLPPLTVRDGTATNLAEILDFKNPKPRRPLYDVPDLRVPTPCVAEPDKWATLGGMAQGFGWLL